MSVNKKAYAEYTKKSAEKSPVIGNCVKAFVCGGAICVIGQALHDLYALAGAGEKNAGTYTSVTLIFAAALLTGLGIFDKIAKFAGAGTLVPITGFANAVVSPALDNKAEGYVMGLGAKIFIIAGPVILYGTLASVLYGVIYYLYTIISV